MEQLGKELEHDFEIEQYIQALKESSSHVRFVMLALIIATIAAAATLLSEREDAWARNRLARAAENYSIARSCGLWEDFDYAAECASEAPPTNHSHRPAPRAKPLQGLHVFWAGTTNCSEICSAADWFAHYGIATQKGAEVFAEKQTRRALVVWLVLVAATIVSWTVGVNHGIDYRVSTVLVLVVTFVKVNLVGMNFMELREAVLPLRAIFNAFCIVVCVGLIGMYLTNI